MTTPTIVPQGLYASPEINIRTVRKAIDVDDTASIERALVQIAAIGAGTVYFPADRHTVVSADLQLPVAGSTHVTLRGAGGFNSRIRRAPTYTGGIFSYVGTVTPNCTIVIRDLFFFSDCSADLSPGAPTIELTGPSPQSILIENCHFWDQYIAISDTDVQNVWIRGCRINNSFESLTSAVKFGGNAGIAFQGHIATCIISDCVIFGQAVSSVQQLTHGIYVGGADGLQIANCHITAQNGFTIAGGNGATVDDVYVTNCIIDNCNQTCVHITGNNPSLAFTNIRFNACHLDAGTSWDTVTSPSSGVVIDGNADCIQFIGCNIDLADRYGVYISGRVAWHNGDRASVLFSGCNVIGNNKNNQAGIQGVYINSPGVSFTGGSSKNLPGVGHQKYGIGVGPLGIGALIALNRLGGNEIAPTIVDAAATGVVITNNV